MLLLIHVALDIWTSLNRYLFLTICAYFVRALTKQAYNTLLALKEIGNHSALEQVAIFYPVLKDFDFTKQLSTFIGDNASANDKFCRDLSKELSWQDDYQWDESQRMRYISHIINLIVQAFFFKDKISIKTLKAFNINNFTQGLRL